MHSIKQFLCERVLDSEGFILLTKEDIQQVAERIGGQLNETPVLTSNALNNMCGLRVFFKCENFQKSGSFKYRGVASAVLALDKDQRDMGLITHSSGNHGAALAAFCSSMGLPVTVVVPESASPYKRRAIERYGAEIIDCGNTLESRDFAVREYLRTNKRVFIPPYDHIEIIAGQGTLGLETLDQAGSLDEFWLPVGGGGLASGNVLSIGASLQVVGAEPDLARDAYESMRLGERQPQLEPKTCADGLRTSLGCLNFDILHSYDLPIVLVSEDEILEAQSILMSCLKILVETSAAVPFAALLKNGPQNSSSEKVGLVISGGNLAI